MRLRHRHPNKVSDNVAVVRGFMSDEVELVSAFADDDRAQMIVSALAAVAHPDFALIDRDSLENAGRPIPLAGYVTAWRHFLESWERLHLVVEDMVEHRNHVVVIARVSGESKVAGILLEDRRAAVWTFKRGRVLRIEQFTTPAEAFDAAGLPAEADPAPEPFVPSLWLAMAENVSA
jgi:ketosteroid isomerase-like protein